MTSTQDTIFCWTRIGIADAGKLLDQILLDKNAQREQDEQNRFVWRIGNRVSDADIDRLVGEVGERPPVLFSLMPGTPKPKDESPAQTLLWRSGIIEKSGETWPLPPGPPPTSGPNKRQWALVCQSAEPLAANHYAADRLSFSVVHRLLTDMPIYAQARMAATHVVRRIAASGGTQPVVLRAQLVWPYIVRLDGPKPEKGPCPPT